MNTSESQPRLSRREVIQWFAAASAAMAAGGFESLAQTPPPPPRGYGTDADLLKTYQPGEAWPLTLTEPQRATTKVLCDLILPSDALGPAASEVGVPVFVDEWVSAPYEAQKADRPVIIEGLAWLDTEARERFQKASFIALSADEQKAICDSICHAGKAKPEHQKAAAFFTRFRAIACGGYFSTPPGWKALGYIGNVPTPTFDGPPKEVLEHLGVEQTVQ